MVVTIVSTAVHRRDMFTGKVRISNTFACAYETLISFAWRKLLVAVSLLAVVALLLYPRFVLLNLVKTKIDSPKSTSRGNNGEEWTEQAVSIVQRSLPTYCQIKDCKVVTCRSIPRGVDPGTLASSFIENDFKIDCKHAETVKLSFDDCKFPSNTLRTNWLTTNLSIEELTFNSCSLNEIEDNVFSSYIYEETKRLTMTNNKLLSLRRAMFHGLEALEELTIRENVIKLAEFNLLEELADSLTILELYHVVDNREVLRNITGGNVTLPKLRIISLRGNTLQTIDRELFEAVPAVQSAYLDYSKIGTVARNTLEPMSLSIQQLILNNNNVSTLPEGLLDRIIRFKRSFGMTTRSNPWHCDCGLKWLQDLVRIYPKIVTDNPICRTPSVNAGKNFTEAEFCRGSNTSSSTVSIATTTESTNHDWNPTISHTTESDGRSVNLTCNMVDSFLKIGKSSRRSLPGNFLQLPARFSNFYVAKIIDEGILVNLPNVNETITLLWFNSDDVENTLNCAKNVKHSYLVQNIDPQTRYTICLLDDNEDTVSPLNCLAVVTSPNYESRTWLRNKDKGLVFSVSMVSFVLLFLLGALVTFTLIRRHPSLLRGSKRVMLVKRRNVDAIVLPKGVNIDERGERSGNVALMGGKVQEEGYVTPLPPARTHRESRVSRESLLSDRNSYVSEVELTESQLTSWRLTRLNGELERQKSEAPPLPPHPYDPIPSLSLAMESKEERAEYRSSILYDSYPRD